MERSLKDLRALKRSYTKEYSGKNLIVNFQNYPFVDFIITHGDGKSWGFFGNGENDNIYLGRGNSETTGITLRSTKFSFHRVDNIIILSNNPEVKRVYTNVLKNFSSRTNNFYYWRDYNIVKGFLKINPILYAKIVDGLGEKVKDTVCYQRELKSLNPVILVNQCENPTSPIIKDAFKMPFKLVNLLLTLGISKDDIEHLINSNYTVQEIKQYKMAFSGWCRLDEHFWKNKQVVKYYCELDNADTYYYRDYLRMINDLPESMRRDFPLTPQVNKIHHWHNKATNLWYKHQAEIQELKNKELNDKYTKEFLSKAEKFEFSDDTYSIIACKKLSELSFEGQILHHCVGSYINSVGNGKEYILFMRKKEELDKPFYTIDVTPEKKVRQIHGLGNSNITDEIKPFVEKWAKKFNLDISNCSGIYCHL